MSDTKPTKRWIETAASIYGDEYDILYHQWRIAPSLTLTINDYTNETQINDDPHTLSKEDLEYLQKVIPSILEHFPE